MTLLYTVEKDRYSRKCVTHTGCDRMGSNSELQRGVEMAPKQQQKETNWE